MPTGPDATRAGQPPFAMPTIACVIRALKEGDRYVDGKLVGADGKVVQVVDDEPDGPGH